MYFFFGFLAGFVPFALGFWLGYRVRFEKGEIVAPEVPSARKGRTVVLDAAVYPDE